MLCNTHWHVLNVRDGREPKEQGGDNTIVEKKLANSWIPVVFFMELSPQDAAALLLAQNKQKPQNPPPTPLPCMWCVHCVCTTSPFTSTRRRMASVLGHLLTFSYCPTSIFDHLGHRIIQEQIGRICLLSSVDKRLRYVTGLPKCLR